MVRLMMVRIRPMSESISSLAVMGLTGHLPAIDDGPARTRAVL